MMLRFSCAVLGNLYIISMSLLYFQPFSQSIFCASRFFWGPRALTVVSARGPFVPESPGVLLPGDSAQGLAN